MNRGFVVALGAMLAGCHGGAKRGIDGWELEHPITGAWTQNDGSVRRVFFHASGTLDDGDTGIFPERSHRWVRVTEDSIRVDGDANSLEVRVHFHEDLVDLQLPDTPITLRRTKDYLVVDDPDGG